MIRTIKCNSIVYRHIIVLFWWHSTNYFMLTLDIPEPYSEYKITVKAFTWKNEGEASDAVTQRTDISGPSAPIVSNLTCHNLDALYLRWKRPAEYYNTIDYYIVNFRSVAQHEFHEIKINASARHLETAVSIYLQLYVQLCIVRNPLYTFHTQMVLPNLTTNTFYEVKVRAASISTINPRQVILGSYSEPQKVHVDNFFLSQQQFSIISIYFHRFCCNSIVKRFNRSNRKIQMITIWQWWLALCSAVLELYWFYWLLFCGGKWSVLLCRF